MCGKAQTQNPGEMSPLSLIELGEVAGKSPFRLTMTFLLRETFELLAQGDKLLTDWMTSQSNAVADLEVELENIRRLADIDRRVAKMKSMMDKTQKNEIEEKAIRLRVENEKLVKELVKEKKEAREKHAMLEDVRIKIPLTWSKDLFDNDDGLKLVPIDAKSNEFAMIQDFMNGTAVINPDVKYGMVGGKITTHFELVQVNRVQNKFLWTEYVKTKRRLAAKLHDCPKLEGSRWLAEHPMNSPLLDPAVNEYWFFHGTKEENVDILIDKGYDNRVCSAGGMFGIEFYLAENSTKSNQYIPCPQCNKNAIFYGEHCKCSVETEYTLLIYRAALGDVHVCKEYSEDEYKYVQGRKLKEPVRRPPSKGDGDAYDCVLGESQKHFECAGLKFREVILYEKYKAYPEFVVTFKRRHDTSRVEKTPLLKRWTANVMNLFSSYQ